MTRTRAADRRQAIVQAAGHLTNRDGIARSIVPAWVHQALENGDNNGRLREN